MATAFKNKCEGGVPYFHAEIGFNGRNCPLCIRNQEHTDAVDSLNRNHEETLEYSNTKIVELRERVQILEADFKRVCNGRPDGEV